MADKKESINTMLENAQKKAEDEVGILYIYSKLIHKIIKIF